jgi:hypothetical protein
LMLWKELFDDLEGTFWWFGRNSLMIWKELFDALKGTLWCFGRNSLMLYLQRWYKTTFLYISVVMFEFFILGIFWV